jgi:hypothetical protein
MTNHYGLRFKPPEHYNIITSDFYEVPGSNLGRDTDHPDKIFRGCPLPIQENAGMIFQIRSRPFHIFLNSSFINHPICTLLGHAVS